MHEFRVLAPPKLGAIFKLETACFKMSNVSFETVVRQRVMGGARSSDIDVKYLVNID